MASKVERKRGRMVPFEEARAIVRARKFKNQKEWKVWSKSGTRPANIPSNPHQSYGNAFISWPDFLGYAGRVRAAGMLSFAMARDHARRLGFKRTSEWHAWAKSDKRPTNIPGNPGRQYKAEFLSMPDWLGYGIGRPKQRKSASGNAKATLGGAKAASGVATAASGDTALVGVVGFLGGAISGVLPGGESSSSSSSSSATHTHTHSHTHKRQKKTQPTRDAI